MASNVVALDLRTGTPLRLQPASVADLTKVSAVIVDVDRADDIRTVDIRGISLSITGSKNNTMVTVEKNDEVVGMIKMVRRSAASAKQWKLLHNEIEFQVATNANEASPPPPWAAVVADDDALPLVAAAIEAWTEWPNAV